MKLHPTICISTRCGEKKGKSWSAVWLGIRDSGLHIYEQLDPESTKSLLSTFLWRDIAKLNFEKKKFEIISEGCPDIRRFTYTAPTEELAKHLLWICQTIHNFHMANQNKVADLKKLELDGGKKCYREAYIYTDKLDQAWEKKQNTISKNKSKLKLENCTVNMNGTEDYLICEANFKPVNKKIIAMPWNNVTGLEVKQDGNLLVPTHHSLEALPLINGCKFSSDVKLKSQSISCFQNRSLTPCDANADHQNDTPSWNQETNSSNTPTLMSRSSCTSNTDSTCSTLSLTSSSTMKLESASRCSNDGNHWVKCDSFEELPLQNSPLPEKVMQKVTISSFVDKHVRTASVYDAISIPKSSKPSFTSPSSNTAKRICVTSSLGTQNSSRKIIDVKRSPSLNVCPTGIRDNLQSNLRSKISASTTNIAQKPPRQYTSNAQGHGRTTTRIGVSSLSREQRLPLTLFNDHHHRILACGSEPNLCAPLNDCGEPISVNNIMQNSQWLQLKLNSRSEMCLNYVIEAQNSLNAQMSNIQHCESNLKHLSLPDVCSDVVDGDFPCIPPPPAYRNDASSQNSPLKSPTQFQLKFSSSERICLPNETPTTLEGHRELRPTYSSPPDVLDIQQLRKQSRDLDLPLISALCNDRSLLMLPKTVPTCSRQRHLGNKDPLRFNRTTSLPNGDGTDILLPNSGRPISWHIESSGQPPVWDNPKVSSSSWDIGLRARLPPPAPMRIETTVVPSLPPTILTSFGKSPCPVKPIRGVHDQSNSDSYRYNKNQMIPTKLLAGPLAGIPNRRLYQKGSSS